MSAPIQHSFKVGDRVRLREDPEDAGVIESVFDTGWVCMEWDKNYGDKLTTLPADNLLPEPK